MKLIYTGDFERLKNFRFEPTMKKQQLIYAVKNKYFIDVVEINVKTREIVNLGDRYGSVVLYDLIQAGLVRKEEENE